MRRFFGLFCGERGIRTPGGVTLNSFQDCRIRPLCHFSFADANIGRFCRITQVLMDYFNDPIFLKQGLVKIFELPLFCGSNIAISAANRDWFRGWFYQYDSRWW